jgi:hypothetical protein
VYKQNKNNLVQPYYTLFTIIVVSTYVYSTVDFYHSILPSVCRFLLFWPSDFQKLFRVDFLAFGFGLVGFGLVVQYFI